LFTVVSGKFWLLEMKIIAIEVVINPFPIIEKVSPIEYFTIDFLNTFNLGFAIP